MAETSNGRRDTVHHMANDNPGGESANPAIEDRRWHSRGYLPHFESRDAIQHVTFHLADSIPRAALQRMENEVKLVAGDKRETEKRRRIEEWIDAGHGSCLLRSAGAAEMVQGALVNFDAQRYRVFAWVVMPNHVHVLFQTMGGWTVAEIVASWKKFTARRIVSAKTANLEIGDPRKEASDREIKDPGKAVWQREYWDRYIRNEKHFWRVVEYIQMNPVKAGLVEKAEEWRWGSAFRGRGGSADQ